MSEEKNLDEVTEPEEHNYEWLMKKLGERLYAAAYKDMLERQMLGKEYQKCTCSGHSRVADICAFAEEIVSGDEKERSEGRRMSPLLDPNEPRAIDENNH